LPDAGDRDRPHSAHPAGAVEARGLERLRRDRLDRGDEEQHVEADRAPDDDEHRRRQRGAHLPEPVLPQALGQQPVEQTVRGVEHLGEDHAGDDGGDDVGEEGDHPVETGVLHTDRLPDGAATDGDQRGEDHRDHDDDERHHDRELDVVPERGLERGVVHEPLVVGEPDDVEVLRERAPVGERVEHRLDERPDHQQQEQRQRQPEEHQEEADAVEGPTRLAARPPSATEGGRAGAGDWCGHETGTTSWVLRASSVIAWRSLVSSSTLLEPSRNAFQTTSWAWFRPYRPTNLWVNVSEPAAASISTWDTSAVEPKPSSGTVSAMTVGASFVLAKLVAASFDSMIRRISLPPATLAASLGTMNGSPASECSAVAGSAEESSTTNAGTPIIWKSSAVLSFISFSIHEPEG